MVVPAYLVLPQIQHLLLISPHSPRHLLRLVVFSVNLLAKLKVLEVVCSTMLLIPRLKILALVEAYSNKSQQQSEAV